MTRVAIPVGGTLAVAGVVLDATNSWGSYSFLVNLASSVVGASFGIPIALVLLSRISHEQAEALREKESEELKRRAAAELWAACRSLLNHELKHDDVAVALSELEALAVECQEARFATDGVLGADKVRAVGELKLQFLSIYGRVTGDADLRARTSEIKGRWAFLLVAVKTRVYETGGRWLDYRAEGWFQHCLDEIDSVLFERMDADVRAASPKDQAQAESRLADLERAALDGCDLVSRVTRLIDAASAIEISARPSGSQMDREKAGAAVHPSISAEASSGTTSS